MERDIFISIRGLHQMQDGDGPGEDIELVSPGHYYERNGTHYISYEEHLGEETEQAPALATVKVEGDCVCVHHGGAFGGQMRFEAGRRNSMFYQTPFGVLEMGVTTQSLQMNLQEHNWQIDVNYSLDINNHFSGDHEVHISVQDRKGESKIRLLQ